MVSDCVKEQNHVVMLKPDKIDEVYEKIQLKCLLLEKIGTIIEKYQFGNVIIKFYITGRLVLMDVDELEITLSKLLG